MILIAVWGVAGLIGRCDARCYGGLDERCECVCGGLNHGAGQSRAIEQTHQYAPAWVSHARQRRGTVTRFEVDLAAQTVPLF